jgi:hypothetical protein
MAWNSGLSYHRAKPDGRVENVWEPEKDGGDSRPVTLHATQAEASRQDPGIIFLKKKYSMKSAAAKLILVLTPFVLLLALGLLDWWLRGR